MRILFEMISHLKNRNLCGKQDLTLFIEKQKKESKQRKKEK